MTVKNQGRLVENQNGKENIVMKEKGIVNETLENGLEYDYGVEPTEEDIVAAEAAVAEEEE